MKCLRTFSDEFYVNASGSPFKKIITEAFLGVSIIDSQSQAKSLLNLLEGERNWVKEPSKPLLNSYIYERKESRDYLPVMKNDSDASKSDFHDFGDLPVYLIDPIGTVEVDDGISVEKINESQVRLHVHVADPSEFVTGRLEEEAKFRSGTIYLPEVKIPMLPESITTLSTLKQKGIKTLTFSCKFDLESGDVLDHQIRRGIINNLNHFTYEEAELITDNPDIELLNRVRRAHLKYRNSRGHLNFSFPRGIAQLDRENEKILVNLEDDKLVMKGVVAEAMIIAGRIAGEYLKERKLPGPFRNHQLENGIAIRDDMSLLEKYQVLKKIEPASVDYEPKRHASMGLDAYVKVTSPLRRYLDLVTHKILKADGSSLYGKEWFMTNLGGIHRQEVYNKRLATSVNRFWIEKYIWQQHGVQELWTLTLLEKFKEGMWMVHVNEIGSNFLVTLRGKEAELGANVTCRLIGKSHETLLKFETV